MKDTLHILHLEDNPDDAELVQDALKREGVAANIKVIGNHAQFMQTLGGAKCDVILSDSSIDGLDGLQALQLVRERWPEVPFIFVSGRDERRPLLQKPEYSAASDWISKSNLTMLPGAVSRALGHDHPSDNDNNPADWYARAVERLIGVVQELSLARNLETIMVIVRRAARQLTGADGATFVLRDGDLCHYADEDAIAPLWKGKRFPMNICISGWAMLNRKAAVIEDIYSDSRIPADAYRPTFVKSLVMVPIRTAEPVGAIGNYWATRRQPRPEEVKLLQALADSTSIAMENVKLYSGLERTVAERTARLQAVNQELEAFSYSVSHDLRAPVRHIGAFIEMVRKDAGDKLSPTSLRHMDIIAKSASQMGTMIDDLLDFSRMGRSEMRQQPVNMNDLVQEVRNELQADVQGRDIVWDIGELPEVCGDRAMLKLVWANLISNAIKYTRERQQAHIKIGAAKREQEIEFFVQDNGVGFEPQYAGKLFGVFQRLHSANEFEGTGIGLANVRRIVSRHGGTTRADARLDHGATFFFTLPLKQPV